MSAGVNAIRLRSPYLIGATKWAILRDPSITAFAGVSEETGSVIALNRTVPSLLRVALEEASAIAAGSEGTIWVATRDGWVAQYGSALALMDSADIEADGAAIAATEDDVVYLTRPGGRLTRVDDLTPSYSTFLPAPALGLLLGDGCIYALLDNATLITLVENTVTRTFNVVATLSLPAVYGMRDMVLANESMFLVGTDRLGNGSVVEVSLLNALEPLLVGVDRVLSPFIVLTTDGQMRIGTVLPQTPYTMPEVPWQGRTDCLRQADEGAGDQLIVRPAYAEVWSVVAVLNLTPPVVTGTPLVGHTLTSTPGTWAGTAPLSFGYQWRRDGVEILGETSNTYLIDIADAGTSLDCVVTATNAFNSNSASSNVVDIGIAPINTVAPVVTGGPLVGATLTTDDGTWTGTLPIVFTYQWQRNGVDIGGETGSTYLLDVADDGTNVRCGVTGTNADGADTIYSNAISVGTVPVNTVTPVVTGGPLVGQVLSTTPGTWTGTATIVITYQWRRNGSNIGGATANTYTLAGADDGYPIDCMVTGTNAFGADSEDSNDINAGSIPVNTVAPVASGTATVGSTLSTTNGTWTGTASIAFTYQWRRNGSNIGAATASTYVVVMADATTAIDCVVTGTNTFGAASQDSNDITIGSADYRTNLWCEYDASQLIGYSNNDPVSTWPDLAGNAVAHDLTSSGGATSPLYKTNILNGLPGIKFDGINDVLARNFTGLTGDEAAFKTGAKHTIFVVASNVPAPSGGAGSDNPIVNAGSAAGTFSYRYMRSYTNSGTSKANIGRDGGGGFDLIVLITPGENLLIAGRYSDTTNDALLRLNGDTGRQAVGTSQSDTASSGISLNTGFSLGGAISAGMLHHIRIYTGALGNTDFATVEAFMLAQWGLP